MTRRFAFSRTMGFDRVPWIPDDGQCWRAALEADMALFGGIEAGGTKFVCAVGTGPHDLRARAEFPTTTPDVTLGCVLEFFKAQVESEPLTAFGIASFGPIDVHRFSPSYGHITSTPKLGWQNV